MKLLVVITAETYPIDLVRFIGERYDELIIPGGDEFSDLPEYYADAMQKSKHVIYPKYHIYEKEEAVEQRNREIVEISDGVLVIRDKKTDFTESVINYAQKLGKKLEYVNI